MSYWIPQPLHEEEMYIACSGKIALMEIRQQVKMVSDLCLLIFLGTVAEDDKSRRFSEHGDPCGRS